jgi:hypothetical protein
MPSRYICVSFQSRCSLYGATEEQPQPHHGQQSATHGRRIHAALRVGSRQRCDRFFLDPKLSISSACLRFCVQHTFHPHMQEPLGSLESMDGDSSSMPSEPQEPPGFRSHHTPITNPFVTQWTIADSSELLTAHLASNPPLDAAYHAAPPIPRQPLQCLGQYPNVSHDHNAPAVAMATAWPSAADLIDGHRNRRGTRDRNVSTMGLTAYPHS